MSTSTLNDAISTLHHTPTHELCDDVVLLEHDGRARLLDLRRCRFYALDDVGTVLLTGCIRTGEWNAIYTVSREFDVLANQVSRDWRNLEAKLEHKGLIARREIPVNLRPPGKLLLAFQLALAWICVRLLRWNTVVALWKGRRRRPEYSWLADRKQHAINALDWELRRTASKHLLNTECKELALVAWRILRCRYGLAAELVLGVIPFPFQAHAWVECDGAVISDDHENCKAYETVKRYW